MQLRRNKVNVIFESTRKRIPFSAKTKRDIKKYKSKYCFLKAKKEQSFLFKSIRYGFPVSGFVFSIYRIRIHECRKRYINNYNIRLSSRMVDRIFRS